MPTVIEAAENWNRRIPTAALNRWLADMVARHPPPAVRGRHLRLRYATQAKSRPPTIAVFANRPKAVPESYKRYLVNGLRDSFNLLGTPIRLRFRASKNPYVDRE